MDTRTRIPAATTLLLTLLCAAALALPARAAIFEPGRVDVDAGIITQDDHSDLYRLALTPVFIKGNLTAAVNINAIVDNEFRLRDNGNDFIVLDRVVWNRDRLKVDYGDIEGITLGRGFIVNNYYSAVTNNLPDNETKGLLFDTWSDRSHFTVFGTLSHLVAGRAERRMGDVSVGATFAVDKEPDMEVMGVDAKLNIIPNSWSVYTEVAEIVDAGNGITVGTAVTPLPKVLDLTLVGEWRKFDADFAPGIVDEHYEAKPILPNIISPNNPVGKVEGFYLAADYYVNSKNSIKLFYEDYESTRARYGLNADAALADRLKFNIFYAQENFIPGGGVRKEDSVVLANLTLALNKYFDLALDYYRAFDDHEQPLESFSTRLKFHLKK